MMKKQTLYWRLTICAAIISVALASAAIFLSLRIPGNLTIQEGERLNISIPLLSSVVDIKNKGFNLEQSNDIISLTASKEGSYDIGFSILGLPVKNATLNVIKPCEVIPGGNTIGIKLYLKGVLVVGLSELVSENGLVSPVREGGLRAGDIITHVNGGKVLGGNDLSKRIQDAGGESVRLTIERDNKKMDKTIKPVYQEELREYKIGAWVKDSTAGIGTLTFTTAEGFAALGHGISDADTGTRLVIEEGSITGCDVTSVVKGEKGAPGELKGVFKNDVKGEILLNSDNGIYGNIETSGISHEPVPIATCSQVQEGAASIYSNVDGNRVESFSIEIVKVMPQSKNSSKGMVIKITDERLLALTGGIVQGMSGSPIIQNGALVGAVTHVFVNDPTKGYGVLAEWMIESLEKAKTDVLY